MKYFAELITEYVKDDEGNTVETCGVRIGYPDGEKILSDLSTDRERVLRLISLFSEERPPFSVLYELAEDFLFTN